MPASEERSISEFPSALSILATTLLFVSTYDSGNDTYDSEKVTAVDLASAILGDFEFTQDLATNVKTIFGAINSIMCLYGNTVPSSSQGTDGQFYVKYTSSGGVDTVDGLYWKINDEWVEISTGGGGGGASVTLGTTVPSDASGSNGDLYVQYDGTTYAVIEYFVKINGSWRKSPYSRVVALTQAEYDLITPDPTTLYIITDAQSSYATKAELATGLATKQDTLTVEDISSGITFTSLENMTDVSVISAYKYGKIVDIFLQAEFSGGAVGINHRCYINFTDNNNRPKSLASTSMFQGTVFFNANLESSGLITIRDFGSSGSLTPYMRFIYICN